jgi:RNA polymerase sigma-70 factor, ECF subfamily
LNDAFETRLVERFKRGDARAMETLLDLYADRALGLAIRLTETREDGEEVAQEALIRAFRHARQFTGGTQLRFGPWLFAIVRSVAADRRRQLRLPTLSLESPLAQQLQSPMVTEDEAIKRAARVDLLDALDSLPEEHRTVLALCDLEDVPHAEAAEVIGKTTAATKSLLYRARRALRDLLVKNSNE